MPLLSSLYIRIREGNTVWNNSLLRKHNVKANVDYTLCLVYKRQFEKDGTCTKYTLGQDQDPQNSNVY